jgi:hypothetical protein
MQRGETQMRVPTRAVLLAVSLCTFCVICFPVLAQENSASTIVRIGVAMPSSGSTAALDLEVRDQLIKAVNRHKADKKLKNPLVAIALEEPPGGRAIAEAEKKDCGFVLYIRVKALPAGHQMTRAADGSQIGDQVVSSYEIEYLLRGVNDGNTYANGEIRSGEFISNREAILEAVGMVGGRVAGDLAKNRDLKPIQTAGTGAIEKIAPGVDVTVDRSLCDALPATISHGLSLRGLRICDEPATEDAKFYLRAGDIALSRYGGNPDRSDHGDGALRGRRRVLQQFEMER